MRTHHLFEIINTNREIQIFQNEKSKFTFDRAGPVLCDQPTNRSQLPVSTRAVQRFCLCFELISGRLPTERRELLETYFYSDYDLNTICHDICAKETYKCLMICDPTDSECISECFRADATCLKSKHPQLSTL